PHLIPITFAVDADLIYTAVDAKPKTTTNLRRLRNIRADPRVAVLADHYEADWDRLWWARAEGLASILGAPADLAAPLELLAARYPQYRVNPPAGPVIAITVDRWTGWAASGGAQPPPFAHAPGQPAPPGVARWAAQLKVGHLARLEGRVGGQVQQPVPAQRGQDDLLLAGVLAPQRFLDAGGDRVRGLRRRQDPLGPGEPQPRLEALRLRLGHRLDQAQLVDVRPQRRHALVAQPARVDRVRHELVPEGVHLEQRGGPGGIAEVVGVHAAGERRARGRLDGAQHRVDPARELLPQEREHQTGEVRPAAGAADDEVRGGPGHRELLDRSLADDRLVQQHVVEHAAERVPGGRVGAGDLDRLADRDAEAAGRVRVLLKYGAPGRGDVGRAGVHGRPVRLHEQPAVRLLVVGRPDHPHLAGEPVQGRRERQRAAPLPGAGLGGELFHALGGVVVRLRDGGVGLVRARRADAFVLVVDPGRGAELLLQPPGAEQRSWPPQPVDVGDRLRNVDKSIWRH